MEREEIFYSSMAKNKKVVVVVEEEELGRRRRRGQPQNYSNNRQALHYLQRARRAPHTHTHVHADTTCKQARTLYIRAACSAQTGAGLHVHLPSSVDTQLASALKGRNGPGGKKGNFFEDDTTVPPRLSTILGNRGRDLHRIAVVHLCWFISFCDLKKSHRCYDI